MATGVNGATVKTTPNGIKYFVTDTKAVITGYSGNAKSLVIPSKLSGKPVTAVKLKAFSSCTCLVSISLPDTLSDIGKEAFSDCINLKKIDLPDSIRHIGMDAFYNTAYYNTSSNWKKGLLYIDNALIEADFDITGENSVKSGTLVIADGAFLGCVSLTKITLPESLTAIPDDAFEFCFSLEKVTIPNSIKKIGSYAFFGCACLSDIVIPKNVTRIGDMALGCCASLTKLEVCDGNRNFHVAGNCLIQTKEKILVRGTKNSCIPTDNSVTKIGMGAFSSCIGMKKNLTIPSSVTTIGEFAFLGCDFSVITIPKSLKTVEADAFEARDPVLKINYQGTKTEKLKIDIFDTNDGFLDADWSYSICKNGKHAYTHTCDRFCNYCNHKRYVSVKHTFSNACDKSCNYCFQTRKTSAHKYTTACDESCNVCGYTRTASHKYKSVTAKATLKKNGSISEICKVCGHVESKTAVKNVKTVKLADTKLTYNGKVRTPAVTVKNSAGKVLKKGKDYTVTYSSGRKNVGTYKVTVKLIGKYSGTKTLTFSIVPKSASINDLTSKANEITVKLNRILKQSTGYQIQYSTSQDFTSAKTVTVYNSKNSGKTVKGLISKTTYYIRVRTYKKLNNSTYCSNWSSVRSIKTK